MAPGRHLRPHAESLREPLSAVQGTPLGLVALILALGLTMAVGRDDAWPTALVVEANAIGTTSVRAVRLPYSASFTAVPLAAIISMLLPTSA